MSDKPLSTHNFGFNGFGDSGFNEEGMYNALKAGNTAGLVEYLKANGATVRLNNLQAVNPTRVQFVLLWKAQNLAVYFVW